MKIDKKVLIFAVLFGLLTVLVLGLYIKSLSNDKVKPITYTQVVVANNTIPANSKVAPEMVTLKSMPTQSIHPEAITSLDKIIGKISKSEIIKGEQILGARVVMDAEKATLGYRVPLGMRAMSIPTSEVTGVAGYINVGDKIDILVTYDKNDINPVITTYTQLQNIEVVAIGHSILSAEEKKNEMLCSITVLVKPSQAEVIAYAISNGKLSYTLRNPIDLKRVNLKYFNSTNFSTVR